MKAKHKDGRLREFSKNTWDKLSTKEKSNWSIEPGEVKKSESKEEVKVPAEVGSDAPEKKGTEVKSSQMTNADATIKISEMKTEEEVRAFTEGDERKGILNAVEKKLSELAEGKNQ